MKLKWIVLFIGGLGLAAALSLTQDRQLTVSDIEWKSFMGKRGAEEQNAYVLMGRGFMGWPGLGGPNFPKELDTEIAEWVKKHPKASVVPVRKLPLSEEFSFIYVWLLDGDENLNLKLVRKGLCDSENMLVDDAELLIEKPKYEQFRHAVLNAEQLAIKEKLGLWAKPGMEGQSHWKKAELLEEQGKLEAAIEEFQAAADFDKEKASSAWYRIGKIHEKLARPDAAILAYDRAIAAATSEIGSRWAQIEKARLLATRGGADPTGEVFGDLKSRCVEDLTPCMDAAVAVAATNPGKSVVILETALLAFLSKHEIAFEGDSVLFDGEKAKRSDKYWMSLHEAASALPDLARYCLAVGEVEKALHYAAKGISIKQNTWGVMAEKLDPLTMEAASFEARLVRAQAFSAKKLFDEAKRELNFAKVLVDTGQIQGSHVNERIDHAYAELRRAFPDRALTVAPKYVPTSKPKPKQYTEVELGSMDENQLVALAAGSDNAASFAALEELVGRLNRGALSEQTTKKLIADGLAHMSGLKTEPLSRRTHASHWRAHYGVFIEDAIKNKSISEQDRRLYLMKMLGIAIDFHRNEASGSPPLHIPVDVEQRVAGSLAGRESFKANWTGTVRIEGGFIDDKPVRVNLRGSDDNTESEGLTGGVNGMMCEAFDFEPLTPGMHTLTVHGQIEIREGDLGYRTDPEDLAKIEPVIRYPFTASAEFEVEK